MTEQEKQRVKEIITSALKEDDAKTTGSKSFALDKQDLKKIGKSCLLGLSGLVVAVAPVALNIAPIGWWTPLISAAAPVIINAAAKYVKDNSKKAE